MFVDGAGNKTPTPPGRHNVPESTEIIEIAPGFVCGLNAVPIDDSEVVVNTSTDILRFHLDGKNISSIVIAPALRPSSQNYISTLNCGECGALCARHNSVFGQAELPRFPKCSLGQSDLELFIPDGTVAALYTGTAFRGNGIVVLGPAHCNYWPTRSVQIFRAEKPPTERSPFEEIVAYTIRHYGAALIILTLLLFPAGIALGTIMTL